MLDVGIDGLLHCVLMQDHIQEEVVEIGGCIFRYRTEFNKQAGNA